MIKILLVADGERDHVTLPHIIGKVLGAPIQTEPVCWARLHSPKKPGRGYSRKLDFAVTQARSRGLDALVAVVDRDKDCEGSRMKHLRQARDEARQQAPAFPTGLGEAIPHGEAWLLDDAVAVRRVLGLDADASVPTLLTSKNPKKDLETLLQESTRKGEKAVTVWADIARQLDPRRYQHPDKTGFERFARELHQELDPHLST